MPSTTIDQQKLEDIKQVILAWVEFEMNATDAIQEVNRIVYSDEGDGFA